MKTSKFLSSVIAMGMICSMLAGCGRAGKDEAASVGTSEAASEITPEAVPENGDASGTEGTEDTASDAATVVSGIDAISDSAIGEYSGKIFCFGIWLNKDDSMVYDGTSLYYRN